MEFFKIRFPKKDGVVEKETAENATGEKEEAVAAGQEADDASEKEVETRQNENNARALAREEARKKKLAEKEQARQNAIKNHREILEILDKTATIPANTSVILSLVEAGLCIKNRTPNYKSTVIIPYKKITYARELVYQDRDGDRKYTEYFFEVNYFPSPEAELITVSFAFESSGNPTKFFSKIFVPELNKRAAAEGGEETVTIL